MTPEQREALDETIVKIRVGRMTRRTFLERVVAVGLTSSAAMALLEACGESRSRTLIHLIWQSEYDITHAYQQMVDNFNKVNTDIHVTWQNSPSATGDLVSLERNILQARSSAIDVMSIDIVYPAEFASKRWVVPISESQWPKSEREKYLPGPIKGCTFDGKLWAAPFRTDVGLIYYRNDIISTPPNSWEELTAMATQNRSKAKYGYVWQGSKHEGLVCNFTEVLHGYGGSILDPNDPTKVTVNSLEAKQALTEMVSWIGTISPPAVLTYLEELTRKTWQDGEAIFMRNWPYAYADASMPTSKVVGKFGVHSMLYGGSNTVGHSTIGGWQLAINAFINSDRQYAAWQFIKHILGPQSQKIGATVATWAVTLQSVYDDPDVLAKVPLFKELKPVVQTSLPRPVTPRYAQFS